MTRHALLSLWQSLKDRRWRRLRQRKIAGRRVHSNTADLKLMIPALRGSLRTGWCPACQLRQYRQLCSGQAERSRTAMKACADSNTPLCWIGEDGMRFYRFGIAPNLDNVMPHKNAAWADK
jgi:hypothetical protein